MTDVPELPGGEVSDTGRPSVQIGDTELEPLPGGEVDERVDRVMLHPQNRRLLVQELVRAGLAFSLVVLLGLVIILGFAKLGTKAWTNTKEFLDVIFPALIALLGSAMGFYFGSRK